MGYDKRIAGDFLTAPALHTRQRKRNKVIRWCDAFFQFHPGKPSNNMGKRKVQQAQSPKII